jgi:hypothetical protein
MSADIHEISSVQHYIIVSDTDLERLAKKVSSKIELGYHVLSQPFVFNGSVCQALTISKSN